jgi:hypothetical protein
VLACSGWTDLPSDDSVLARLLELNLGGVAATTT